jgi:DNA-binding LacI/PurR family transcriptional regulator
MAENPPSNPPTIRDVAQRAGVSIATASYALRDSRRISSKTREKVHEAATALGYVPNRAAAIMASRRFREQHRVEGCRIAIVRPSSRRIKVRQADQWALEAANRRAHELGHDLMEFEMDEQGNLQRWADKLYYQGVDGIILTRRVKEELLGQIDWGRFAVLAVGPRFRDHGFDSFRSDYGAAVRLGYERLRAAGYQRIGAVLSKHEPELLDDRERLAAFLECETRFTPQEQRLPIPRPPVGEEDARKILQWFKQHRPDAVVALTVGPYHHLKAAGVKFPDQCAYIALAQWEQGGQELTSGFDQCFQTIYRRAIEQIDLLMKHRIHGRQATALDITFPPAWIDAGTI